MVGELIAGGGIAVVALVIGHFEGYLMGTKVRNVSQLAFAPDGDTVSTLPCLCGHPVTMHREHGKSSCSAFDLPGSNTVAPGAAGPGVAGPGVTGPGVAGSGAPVACACKFFAADPAAVPRAPRGQLEL